jgi:hypothetical protein
MGKYSTNPTNKSPVKSNTTAVLAKIHGPLNKEIYLKNKKEGDKEGDMEVDNINDEPLTQPEEYSDTEYYEIIPNKYNSDPIKDKTVQDIFSRVAQEPTMFNKFQDTITAVGKRKEQVLNDGLKYINNQFQAKLNGKTIHEKTEIKDLIGTKPPTIYELLLITKAFAYLQILKLRADPNADSKNNINTTMQRINQLKIFLLDHKDLAETIENMFTSVMFDEFLVHFNTLVGLISTVQDTVVKVETQALIDSIFDLRTEYYGRSAAPPAGDDETTISIDSNATTQPTKVHRTRLILAHTLFPKHVLQADLEDAMMERFDVDIFKALNEPVNIEAIFSGAQGSGAGTLHGGLDALTENKIMHMAFAIMVTNGNYLKQNFPPDDSKIRLPKEFMGGKSRKTRKIKKTKRTNKKNKRNTKKGRKMRQTRKK